MRKKRKRYVYVDTTIEKETIKNFWVKKTEKIKKATEIFMQNPNILIKDIEKEYGVYVGSFYSHFYRLKTLGLIYNV